MKKTATVHEQEAAQQELNTEVSWGKATLSDFRCITACMAHAVALGTCTWEVTVIHACLVTPSGFRVLLLLRMRSWDLSSHNRLRRT
jgi:hypothetical protein